MLMYADDTTLYCNLNGVNFEVKLNNELSKISEWLSSNKLSLNIKKTKFFFFHMVYEKKNTVHISHTFAKFNILRKNNLK